MSLGFSFMICLYRRVGSSGQDIWVTDISVKPSERRVTQQLPHLSDVLRLPSFLCLKCCKWLPTRKGLNVYILHLSTMSSFQHSVTRITTDYLLLWTGHKHDSQLHRSHTFALTPHSPRSGQLYPLLHACFGQACNSSMGMLQRIDKQSGTQAFPLLWTTILAYLCLSCIHFFLAHGKPDLAVADAITSTRIRWTMLPTCVPLSQALLSCLGSQHSPNMFLQQLCAVQTSAACYTCLKGLTAYTIWVSTRRAWVIGQLKRYFSIRTMLDTSWAVCSVSRWPIILLSTVKWNASWSAALQSAVNHIIVLHQVLMPAVVVLTLNGQCCDKIYCIF